MRAKGLFGRYPDVQFMFGHQKVVLEAQTSTITLHGINGRRDFSYRLAVRLLWIMRHFGPGGPLRVSVRDIVADQAGVLFSVDAQTEARSCGTGRFLVRAWRCEWGAEGGEAWGDAIVAIEGAVHLVTPPRWADDFKQCSTADPRGRSRLPPAARPREGVPREIRMAKDPRPGLDVRQRGRMPGHQEQDRATQISVIFAQPH